MAIERRYRSLWVSKKGAGNNPGIKVNVNKIIKRRRL
jgi:hypothetical protein